jgi:hypothetical protein
MAGVIVRIISKPLIRAAAAVPVALALLAVGVVPAGGAEAGGDEPAPAAAPALAPMVEVQPQQVPEVEPVDPGPDGSVVVPSATSKALQGIPALPAVDPPAGEPNVAVEAVTPEPPVGAYRHDLPLRPGQELVDATATSALETLDAAGRLIDGAPALAATDLQPQVSRPQFLDDGVVATEAQLAAALESADLSDLPVDPLALLEQLPEGLPRLTYRVCSEAETKETGCSLTLPIGVPALVDVTGDGTPDVLADMVPVAALGDVVGAVEEITDLEAELDAVTSRLETLLELVQDPLWLIQHPEALLEVLRLQNLVETLTQTLVDKVEALAELVHLGLALLEIRLPTSELVGQDLPGHVWGVYDLPGGKRLSVGFDGFRRGTSLPTATLGVFTFNPLKALRGEYDIKASLLQVGAGDALAVTAGLADVADTDAGEAIDPTVASARFSPVPNAFTARAWVRPPGEDSDQRAVVTARSSEATQLDTQVIANAADGTDRFTQLLVDRLPTTVEADLRRSPDGLVSTLDYDADAGIDDVGFADFVYDADAVLEQAVRAEAAELPASFTGELRTGESATSLDYSAASRLAALDVDFYHGAGGIVLRGGLRDLPTDVDVLADSAAGHVVFAGSQALGRATVEASRNLGDFSRLDGDHATLVTDAAADAYGVSATVSGLRLVDGWFDGHPRLRTEFDPGGQPFTAAADLDGVHKARMDLSNLPAVASLDVDTVAQAVRYEADSVIEDVRVAYTNTQDGPTVVAGVEDLPAQLALDYEIGDVTRLDYEASSAVPRIEFFASPDHIEQLRPIADHYASAAVIDLPATVDFIVDLATQHLEGTQSAELGGIDVAARFPVAGRDWFATGSLRGLPAEFDADWADGNYRFRGITGPLRSAEFAASNHTGATAPTGLHLAAHYQQASGDLDASIAVRNLSHVEYSRGADGQTFRLDTDTGGDPVFIDVDAVLTDSAGNDDTRLQALGQVDNLPATLDVTFADGRMTYSADRRVGLQLGVRIGKVAALDGLGTPLFENGVALTARACTNGQGCAADDTPFCGTPEGSCLGAVGTINLAGLPTEVVVDTAARTVALTGYQPPSPTLKAYLRLIDVVPTTPDARVLATLSDLPAELDLTVGPVVASGGQIDARYTASAPLGDLRIDADLRTTDATFPVIRGRATVDGLPQSVHVTGRLGQATEVVVDNSGPVDGIGLRVTGDSDGYLDASVSNVPASARITADVAASHLEAEMSAPIDGISFLARDIPYEGRQWSAYANLTSVPAAFEAAWGGGTFGFQGTSGPLGRAEVAVTNHGGATAPIGSHLAVHYREATGDTDASASIADVSSASYTHTGSDFTARFDAGSQTIGVDADVLLAAGGADDTRLGMGGRIGPLPSTMTVTSADGAVRYSADRSLDLEAQLWLGKVAALDGLGTPRFENGISLVDRACDTGPGCAADETPFCTDGGCFGATAIINVSGLPSSLEIDPGTNTYSFAGYQPSVNRLEFYVEDEVFVPDPVTSGKVLVTLTDLPADVATTVGPIKVDEEVDVRFASSTDTVAGLDVHAEAHGVPAFGDVYAKAVFSPIPGSMHVTGSFGADSQVTTDSSAVIDELSLRVTGSFEGEPASALVSLTDVPTAMTFDVGGFAEGSGFKVPTVGYTSNASTLDGNFHLEAAYYQQFDDITAGVTDAYFEFEDLGQNMQLTVDPETKAAFIDSDPATSRFTLGAAVYVGAVPVTELDEELWQWGGIVSVLLQGHFGLDPSAIGLRVDLNAVTALEIRPGALNESAPVDLPDELGYIFQGFDGQYSSVDVTATEVDLNPDVDVVFRVDKIAGPDFFKEEFVLQGHKDDLRFHAYNGDATSTQDFDISTWGIGIGCVQVRTVPGESTVSPGSITLDGASGPHLMTLVDPISHSADESVPGYVLNMFAAWMSPYEGAATEIGSC